MQRRRLLQLGLGAAAVLAVAGGGVALLRPGLVDGRLGTASRDVFRAIGATVLDGSLPDQPPEARERALDRWLLRVDELIVTLPGPTQSELSQLLALLATMPGRIVLAGLNEPWTEASVPAVHEALQQMRTSSLAVRRQAYQALREIACAAYFSDPASWQELGYPGPVRI